ncbi:MAG: adenylyltransferase/cytidyltransferase family protein [Candidatus Nanohaloarchaea archaeon]|nr:adenylyltransferase/cytidyltransferase family protein [Candidatus Nanohaloarchaea archaeon]
MTDPDALVVGRFQPFHRGHEALVEYARSLEEAEDVLIGLGIPEEKETERNPLRYEEREQIITSVLPGVEVFGIEDQGDDAAWVAEVEEQAPTEEFLPVTGNDWTARCFEQAGYDVEYLGEDELYEREKYRGTDIRERAREGEAWRHLVPDGAAEELDEIGFEERVRDTAVIVGRFQPLHEGHVEMIDAVLDDFEEVYLGVAVCDDEPTEENPLGYGDREAIFDEVYGEEVETFPVEDAEDCDRGVAQVESYVGEGFIAVTGNEETKACFESHGYSVHEPPLYDRETYEGEKVRSEAQNGGDWKRLVPDDVASYLDEVGFEERLAAL